MKEFLANLNPRERRLLYIGSAVAAVLLLYLAVWAPLSAKVDRLREGVARQQALEAWMQQASQEVQRLRKATATGSGQRPRQSLLALTDQSARQRGLAQAIKRVQPDGQDKVNIRLEGAAFDDVVTWLETLQSQYRVSVATITIDRQDQPGLVDVRLTLQGGTP